MHLATFKLMKGSHEHAQQSVSFISQSPEGSPGSLDSRVGLKKRLCLILCAVRQKGGTGMHTGKDDMNRGLLMDLRTFWNEEIECRSAG